MQKKKVKREHRRKWGLLPGRNSWEHTCLGTQQLISEVPGYIIKQGHGHIRNHKNKNLFFNTINHSTELHRFTKQISQGNLLCSRGQQGNNQKILELVKFMVVCRPYSEFGEHNKSNMERVVVKWPIMNTREMYVIIMRVHSK